MKKKRLLSVFLVLVMAHTLMTTNVFAEDQKDTSADGMHSIHCICGVIDCNDNEHGKSLTWTGINSLSEITEDGNYYLKQDVTLDDTWECNYNVNICLDGKTITGKDGKDVISVTSEKNFGITDCQNNVGKITHNNGETGRGIYNNGKFTLWNGSISENVINDSYAYGAGVYNDGNGILTMKGGNISNNKSGYGGSGVFNGKEATFVMDDGSISGNLVTMKFKHGGGVLNEGEFTMNSGNISGNSAYFGGGVYNNGDGKAIFTMTGGVIGGDGNNSNTSVYSGGGICNIATFNMSGNAAIIGNKTQDYGGGVDSDWGIIRLSGNVKIIRNTASDNTNNVYIGAGDTIVTTGMGTDACVGITGHYAGQTVVKGTSSTTGLYSDNKDYELVSSDNITGLIWKKKPIAPVIDGAEDGKTYCGAVTLTITGDDLDTVTLDGKVVTLTDNELTLEPKEGKQTVIATNKAGNQTMIAVTVNNGHTWDNWKSNGDNTHSHTCKVDGCKVTDTANCNGGTATCQAKAVCDDCHEIYGNFGEHDWNIKTWGYKSADGHAHICNTVGCTEHDTVVAHTKDRDAATENEPVKCTDCSYVIAPALGHICANHLDYVEAKAATSATEGNIAYWYCAVCDKYFSHKNASKEIKKEDTIIAKLAPVIIKGDKATISVDEKKELSFTSDAIYEDFIRVEVDGKTVDESNYTVKSGSTIVTLNADYVASLSEGNHTLSIVSTSGTATAGFTINKKETETVDKKTEDMEKIDTKTEVTEIVETAPKTGDKNYPVFWISMFTCSIMALGFVAVTGRRKRKDI